jgi:hypothetical protein
MISKQEIINNSINFNTDIDSILRDNKTSINVIWSGGCDSTLILYDILTKLKSSCDDRVINTWTFNHYQLNTNKMAWERQKRQRFIIWAEDKGFKNKILNREINLPNEEVSIGTGSCCQIAIWTSNIVPILSDKSIVFAGYHKGDDFFTYNNFKNWMKLFKSTMNLYGKSIKFFTPLAYKSKYEIIRDIKNVDGLYDNTWWCESVNNNGEPCGYCLPCETHKSALLYYEYKHKHSILSTIKKEEKDIIKVDNGACAPAPIDSVITISNSTDSK